MYKNNFEDFIEYLSNLHLTKKCGKPTPLSVGWIARFFELHITLKMLRR